MLLYTQQQFNDVMDTQEINLGEWHNQFGQTLHRDPSNLWQEVLTNGENNGDQFDADKDGFNLVFKFYVRNLLLIQIQGTQ